MRTIVNSRTYQAGIATNEWNEKDADNFSHAIPRRLTAEQLMDALALATGVRPVLPEVPPDTKAEQFVDPHVGKEGFLDLFGRPARESACECERRADLSLPQALNLVNGKTISDAVADAERARRQGRLARRIGRASSSKSCISPRSSRSALRAEVLRRSSICLPLSRGRHRRPGCARQDLLWALVNSKAFLYNY